MRFATSYRQPMARPNGKATAATCAAMAARLPSPICQRSEQRLIRLLADQLASRFAIGFRAGLTAGGLEDEGAVIVHHGCTANQHFPFGNRIAFIFERTFAPEFRQSLQQRVSISCRR